MLSRAAARVLDGLEGLPSLQPGGARDFAATRTSAAPTIAPGYAVTRSGLNPCRRGRRQRRGNHLDQEDHVTALATARLGDPSPTPMDLLAQGVPLSLLLDLFYGPPSEDILREESVRAPAQQVPQR